MSPAVINSPMIEQTCRDNLIAIATAYAKAKGITLDAVSKQVYGKSAFLREFKAGARSVSLFTFDEIVAALRADWPPGASWPYVRAALIPPPKKIGRKSLSASTSQKRIAVRSGDARR